MLLSNGSPAIRRPVSAPGSLVPARGSATEALVSAVRDKKPQSLVSQASSTHSPIRRAVRGTHISAP